jgi:hypothetical protein
VIAGRLCSDQPSVDVKLEIVAEFSIKISSQTRCSVSLLQPKSPPSSILRGPSQYDVPIIPLS